MKKAILFLFVALMGVTAFGQMGNKNIIKQIVVTDSMKYSEDSVPRVYFKVVRTIQDTLFGMNSTPSELINSIKIAQDRVRFTDQAVRAQLTFLRDSITDKRTQQYVLQEVYRQNSSAVQYRTELEMLRKIRAKFVEEKVIK
jgi:hypothetical protein